jgi:hypothetical protein
MSAGLTRRLLWHLDPTSCRELCGASLVGLSAIQIWADNWADLLAVVRGSPSKFIEAEKCRTSSKQSRRCPDCPSFVYRRSSLSCLPACVRVISISHSRFGRRVRRRRFQVPSFRLPLGIDISRPFEAGCLLISSECVLFSM